LIKLIAIDLDETLLDEKWRISERNERAIREAVARGVRVTLATGRMALSARRYARELELDVPIITYQGALIEQALSREVLYRQAVAPALALEIIRDLTARGIYSQVFLENRVFTAKHNAHSDFYRTMTGITVEEADMSELLGEEGEGPLKILCIGEEETLDQIRDEYLKTYQGRLHLTRSRGTFLEMLDYRVNKGNALKALAEGWGIRAEEVMAIGDGLNDKEMIIYAGIGVAMGNGHPELKKAADYITASHQQDGVAQAIEKFVLTYA